MGWYSKLIEVQMRKKTKYGYFALVKEEVTC